MSAQAELRMPGLLQNLDRFAPLQLIFWTPHNNTYNNHNVASFPSSAFMLSACESHSSTVATTLVTFQLSALPVSSSTACCLVYLTLGRYFSSAVDLVPLFNCYPSALQTITAIRTTPAHPVTVSVPSSLSTNNTSPTATQDRDAGP